MSDSPYQLLDYGSMMNDRVRMQAYEKALRRSIRPGMKVLDIGTGTGILALLACRHGAGRVWAVEPGDCLEVARQLVVANGFGDRVELVQGLSTDLEPVAGGFDMVVSDLRGVLPLLGRHLPTIVDARERLLATDGVLIPQHDTLWAAVVEAPNLYHDYVSPWQEGLFGFDLTPALELTTQFFGKGRPPRRQLLVEPQPWATLDYRSLASSQIAGHPRWQAKRHGMGHGLCLWFDTILYDDVGFSTAPWRPRTIYGTAFLPWTRPVAVAAGDEIAVDLAATLVGEDYTWTWATEIRQGDGVVQAFRQSTFFGAPLTAKRLRRRQAGFVPRLSTEGRIDRFILERMDGGASLGDIAGELEREFPDRFVDSTAALTRVGDLANRYARDRPDPCSLSRA